MRALLLLLAALLLLLQYRLWISEDGWREVWGLRDAIHLQRDENKQLLDRNQRLEAEVRDLREGLDAAEEIARTDLGMIGPGETLYQIAAPEPDQGEGGGQ
jgi:cell division protein FtsB